MQVLIATLDGKQSALAFVQDEDAVLGHYVAGGRETYVVTAIYGTRFTLGREARRAEHPKRERE